MKISIALATYNGAAHLGEQLESLARQTRLPDELVVSDDASTDETVEILEQFKSSAAFSVTIEAASENVGYSRNFEKTLARCSGDLIFLCDQDDVWYPSKLATIEEVFVDSPETLLVISDMDLADGDLRSSGRSQLDQNAAAGQRHERYVAGCCTAFRSSVLELALPFPNVDVAHDRWIHEVTRAAAGRQVLGTSLQLYRRHDKNTTMPVLSSPSGPTLRAALRAARSPVERESYHTRAAVLQHALERQPPRIDEPGTPSVAMSPSHDARHDIEREIGALRRRARLLDASWLRRRWYPFELLVRGDYAYFLGWRSFVRDLAR